MSGLDALRRRLDRVETAEQPPQITTWVDLMIWLRDHPDDDTPQPKCSPEIAELIRLANEPPPEAPAPMTADRAND